LQPLDLRSSLFRYRLRAVDQGGNPLTGLDGPILARGSNQDGSPADTGFRWRKGKAELITEATTLSVVVFGKGFPATALQLLPGDHDVYLQPLQPALVTLPGARMLCGNGRAVRVSMVFTGDTGLPQALAGIDQRSGEQFTFPRWELGKSGGAWLGVDDTVAVPLARGGPHEVLLRLYEDERQDGTPLSISVGVVEVVVDGPLPLSHTLPVDPQKIAAAVAELERRRQQRQAGPRAGR
ncbi:MAG TPA: hypothetical protein VK348_02490, partial [Planctomycetota bacterium]|nr:hypothetical protein [Planctomycetota bacterium]